MNGEINQFMALATKPFDRLRANGFIARSHEVIKA
jgi:hypothetical protein